MHSVFVTGASGFIGRHLVAELIARGVHVKCLVRSGAKVEHLQNHGVEFTIGSLEAPESFGKAVRDCDTVIHLAGLVSDHSKERLFEINGGGCGAVAAACEAASNPPRMVYISSLAAAGPPPLGKDLREESDEPEPISNYGRSKRLGEVELQKLAGRLPVTVIRPGIVFGPGDRALVPVFRSIYLSGFHVVVGFRTPPLALIYVQDLVPLVLQAAERGETLLPDASGHYSPQGYYFACDDSDFPNYWELGQRIAASMDRKTLVWPLWRWVGFSMAMAAETAARLAGRPSLLNIDKIREATSRSWACTSQKARKQLGFAPAHSLDERLKQTAQWYEEHNWL